MNKAFQPDYKGQRVKVAYPGDDTAYSGAAAYITFNEAGVMQASRSATDAEVQWWMSLQHMDTLTIEMRMLNEALQQLRNMM